MAFVPVADTAMIEIIYLYQGQQMENTLYYSGLNVNQAAVLQGLAENAFLMWQNTFRSHQSTALSVLAIKATDLSSESGPTYMYIPASGNVGQSGGEGLPANCAVLISMYTAKRGKSYRGRLYIPGLTESFCSNSTVASTVTDALTAAFASWDFLDVGGEPYGQQIVSRYHNNQPRILGEHTDVTGWKAKSTVASQRRRLPGRGI